MPYPLPGFVIDSVEVEEERLVLYASSEAKTCPCPTCKAESTNLHGWYERRPQDLPCMGKQVKLHLRIRRFRCMNATCSRKTFGERFPKWLAPHAQRTAQLTRFLYRVGLEVGGECGARILSYAGASTSGDTLLRTIRGRGLPEMSPARVVGIDDWAFKKGERYGTIIVDLEAHRVVDLLPDRTSSSVAAWLEQQPQVEIVARDRSTEYATGIQLGAPQAQQVADRWHLLLNLQQMLDRVVSEIYPNLSYG